MPIRIFTIGFTKKSAEIFFGILRDAGVKRLIDTRLNNVSQLAGFAKRDDLRYFLSEICGIEYRHEPMLAPEQRMLDGYRKEGIGWNEYERQFLSLMSNRAIDTVFSPELFDGACLLCSEETAEHCHRRLVVQYLASKWDGIEIVHL